MGTHRAQEEQGAMGQTLIITPHAEKATAPARGQQAPHSITPARGTPGHTHHKRLCKSEVFHSIT